MSMSDRFPRKLAAARIFDSIDYHAARTDNTLPAERPPLIPSKELHRRSLAASLCNSEWTRRADFVA
jgi:hypothetical protein